MIVVDVNVLLAAFRADHVHHARARPWLERTLEAGVRIIVPDLVWVGFLRLVTNSHIFDVPATPAEAFEFVDAVCAAPSYANLRVSPTAWPCSGTPCWIRTPGAT